jgi:hypothetical protein
LETLTLLPLTPRHDQAAVKILAECSSDFLNATETNGRAVSPCAPLAIADEPVRCRHIAVAVPARSEERQLPACLTALDEAAGRYGGPVTIVVSANNCTDGTVALLQDSILRNARLSWHALSLLPEASHAGWARRLAFDAAAAVLDHPNDVLASTDADTCVAPDWLVRTVAHLDADCDAVAGRALTRRLDRLALGGVGLRRLNLLGRYHTALDWLRADMHPAVEDPWPRHFYEGGASIALSLQMYHRIEGAPTPPVAEDRALFAAVRAAGGRIRHPLDVRVFTSSRTEGRAPGGMADAFARWIIQSEDEPIHETYGLRAALDPGGALPSEQLSFRSLPAAFEMAGAMIRSRRSATPPQVEPILVPSILADDGDGRVQQASKYGDCLVA